MIAQILIYKNKRRVQKNKIKVNKIEKQICKKYLILYIIIEPLNNPLKKN